MVCVCVYVYLLFLNTMHGEESDHFSTKKRVYSSDCFNIYIYCFILKICVDFKDVEIFTFRRTCKLVLERLVSVNREKILKTNHRSIGVQQPIHFCVYPLYPF